MAPTTGKRTGELRRGVGWAGRRGLAWPQRRERESRCSSKQVGSRRRRGGQPVTSEAGRGRRWMARTASVDAGSSQSGCALGEDEMLIVMMIVAFCHNLKKKKINDVGWRIKRVEPN